MRAVPCDARTEQCESEAMNVEWYVFVPMYAFAFYCGVVFGRLGERIVWLKARLKSIEQSPCDDVTAFLLEMSSTHAKTCGCEICTTLRAEAKEAN